MDNQKPSTPWSNAVSMIVRYGVFGLIMIIVAIFSWLMLRS